MRLPDITALMNPWKNRQEQERVEREKVLAERERVMRLASDFDKLIVERGWEQILKYMSGVVNDKVYMATGCPLEPEKQRVYIIQWNAMRELFDSMQALVNDTLKERERIKAEIEDEIKLKEEENDG